MTIKATESNQPFRLAPSFVLSSNTGLTLQFTSPSGTVTTHTKASSPAVTAPAVALTNDPELGDVAASTYFELFTTTTTFTEAGTWTACGKYTDTATTPDTIIETLPVTFTIGESCF